MLDVKLLRQEPELLREELNKRNLKDMPASLVDDFLALDEKYRNLLAKKEEYERRKNEFSREIVKIKDKSEKEKMIREMREGKDAAEKMLGQNLKDLEKKVNDLLFRFPNLSDPSVPPGRDASENQVDHQWGKKTKFNFKPKDYLELGEKLDIIDVKKAGAVSGTRFGYLKGGLARLEFALVQLAFDTLTNGKIIQKIAASVDKKHSAKTFVPIVPPVMIKPEVYTRMARLSEEDKNERYYIPSDDIYLVGSSEHTLGPLHMDETLAEEDLPKRYCGFSTCFRREAGSYGKDTKGILRVHQFDKVEIVSFSLPEDSRTEQNFIVAIQEYLMQSLKIPYQVIKICSGDMGRPDARQIDLESWLPGAGEYRETHTSDLNTDYQARRLNTRVKRKNGKTEIAHMNDATVFAIGRTLIAIIENYQREDGSIEVPQVLQKYCGLKEIK
ncbi:serine--tRNA ligase [bacterium (Candidatus Torokbacteria) CG09_land_8_20_14_0_10_42_11]|nr:MAG: serine--tRNA ligase [bacterium (Candidatus Torokbacteria) CG09_land_8_20_14_0_10_42_11]